MFKEFAKKIGGRIYNWSIAEKRVNWTRGLYHLALRVAGKGLGYRIENQKREYFYRQIRQGRSGEGKTANFNLTGEKPLDGYEPSVTVIVPNYNHAVYLRQRLDSIYGQTYRKFDVILLDDASSDDSVEILKEYADRYKECTRLVINERNSGNAFSQWAKGMEMARGELIWVAESDDYCEPDFLSKLIPCFRYQSVKIAFSQSQFIRDGRQIWSTKEYLCDLLHIDWENNFILSSSQLVKYGFAIQNVIANVSSALFRGSQGMGERLRKLTDGMTLCGDWIFYLDFIRGGAVAYRADTVNYYRIHEGSTSLRVQRTDEYYRESEKVSCYAAENYKVDFEAFEKVLCRLKEHRRSLEAGRGLEMRQDKMPGEFPVEKLYSLDKIRGFQEKRRMNIAIACYAMRSGGGEIYPMLLASAMRVKGHNVALINFRMEPTQPEIRSKVDASVPVVEVRDLGAIGELAESYDWDIVHSHQANVDEVLAMLHNGFTSDSDEDGSGTNRACFKPYGHVITLHGGYEAIPKDRSVQIMGEVCRECARFIYIAEKNKAWFVENGFYREEKFIKIPNGLPRVQTPDLTREMIGVKEDDFVIVLASRAISEKGWEQAIDAVKIVCREYSDKVVLFLLGEGEERKRLLERENRNIRLPGNCENVRSYFRLADVALLPTTYSGESYPLTVIESLQEGTPVIASDVGEIRQQLMDENGEYAGELLTVHEGIVLPDEIADILVKYMRDPHLLKTLRERTIGAAQKFDFDKIVDRHVKVYEEVFRINA